MLAASETISREPAIKVTVASTGRSHSVSFYLQVRVEWLMNQALRAEYSLYQALSYFDSSTDFPSLLTNVSITIQDESGRGYSSS